LIVSPHHHHQRVGVEQEATKSRIEAEKGRLAFNIKIIIKIKITISCNYTGLHV